MELTYKVRGADGNEYGPATLADINTWLREGRITSDTQVTRSDIDYWCPAGNFSELEVTRAATPAVTARPVEAVARPAAVHSATAAQADPAAMAQLKSGASWFYWIAGLSLINSIVAFTGGQWAFLFGLGITQ